ncbi:hypothetical protein [Nocardioides convexus]|uniref:hypothetical protein n=1 Tax=Nocardioides convexus TaxID=2712224 RepID=UPI0024184181|nr:hypothetical protein [Nocardioides convexus]
MGLIQAAIGAIGGTLGDQWLDFYGVPDGITSTIAVFPAVAKGQNAGRGSNTHGSDGVITNGSKIVVPEGYGLVLLEDGAFTGFAAEPGAYIWNSDEPASQSVFSGGGLVDSVIKQSLGALQVRRTPLDAADGGLRDPQGACPTTSSAPSRRSTGTTPSSTPRSVRSPAAPTRSRSPTR